MMKFQPGWQGLAGFRRAQQKPSALSESVYLQIFVTKHRFIELCKQIVVVVVVFGCNSVKSGVINYKSGSPKALRKHALQKLSESKLFETRLSESSLKQALQKLSESKLSESRPSESFPKAGSPKAL